MSDVGHIDGAQQQLAATVLGLANSTTRAAQQLVEQAAETVGPPEEGKGAHIDEQA